MEKVSSCPSPAFCVHCFVPFKGPLPFSHPQPWCSHTGLGSWELSRYYSFFFPEIRTNHSLAATPDKALIINWSFLKFWQVNQWWLCTQHRVALTLYYFPILHHTLTCFWRPKSHLCLPSAVVAEPGETGFLSSLPSPGSLPITPQGHSPGSLPITLQETSPVSCSVSQGVPPSLVGEGKERIAMGERSAAVGVRAT